MGLDPLFTMANGGSLTTGINYIIVSNASGNIEHKSRKYSFSIENLKRLLDINMDQVESLKSNGVIDYFRKEHNGLYFKIGTEVKDIVKDCSLSYEQKESMIKSSMKSQDVSFVKDYKTTLEKVNIENFHKILQHGYETSKYTIASYGRIS